jgi:hypothetical protein
MNSYFFLYRLQTLPPKVLISGSSEMKYDRFVILVLPFLGIYKLKPSRLGRIRYELGYVMNKRSQKTSVQNGVITKIKLLKFSNYFHCLMLVLILIQRINPIGGILYQCWLGNRSQLAWNKSPGYRPSVACTLLFCLGLPASPIPH